MRCAAARRRILKLVDDELPLRLLPELDQHLEACEECQSHYQAHLQLQELVTTAPTPDVGPIFEDAFLDRLNRRIDEEGQLPASSRPNWMRPTLALIPLAGAAAAVILLFALGGFGSAPGNIDTGASSTELALMDHQESSKETQFAEPKPTLQSLISAEPSSEANLASEASSHAPPQSVASLIEASPKGPGFTDRSEAPSSTDKQREDGTQREEAVAKGAELDSAPTSNVEPRAEELLGVREQIAGIVASAPADDPVLVTSEIELALEPLRQEGWPVEEHLARLACSQSKEEIELLLAERAILTLASMETTSARMALIRAYDCVPRRSDVLRACLRTQTPEKHVTLYLAALDDTDVFDLALQGLLRTKDSASMRAASEGLGAWLTSHYDGQDSGGDATPPLQHVETAIHALAQLGPSCVRPLMQLIKKGADPHVIAEGLNLAYFTPTSDPALKDAVVAQILDAIDGRVSTINRTTAMQLIGPLRLEEAVPSLASALRRRTTTRPAAEALSRLGSPLALSTLIEIQDDSRSRSKTAKAVDKAIQDLLASSDIDGAGVIQALDDAPSNGAILSLVGHLENTGGSAAAAALAELFADHRRPESVRLASAEALSRVGDQRHLTFLVDWATRTSAYPESVTTASRDSQSVLRGAALIAARRLGGSSALSRIEARLGHPLPPSVVLKVNKLADTKKRTLSSGSLQKIGRALKPKVVRPVRLNTVGPNSTPPKDRARPLKSGNPRAPKRPAVQPPRRSTPAGSSSVPKVFSSPSEATEKPRRKAHPSRLSRPKTTQPKTSRPSSSRRSRS